MDRFVRRPAVAFETPALDEAARDGLMTELAAAFPKLAELSLKQYKAPGWIGSAELMTSATADEQARLAAWLRRDRRVVAATVRTCTTERFPPEVLAALRAEGIIPPE